MIVIRKRLLFAPFLSLLVLLLVLVSLAEYRRRTFDAQWAKLRFDMSKDEVRELLGEPDQIYSAGPVHPNAVFATLLANWLFDSSYEKWAYGERRLFKFGPTFPYVDFAWDGLIGPENRDHVVYFTSDGKVLKKRYPYVAGVTSH